MLIYLPRKPAAFVRPTLCYVVICISRSSSTTRRVTRPSSTHDCQSMRQSTLQRLVSSARTPWLHPRAAANNGEVTTAAQTMTSLGLVELGSNFNASSPIPCTLYATLTSLGLNKSVNNVVLLTGFAELFCNRLLLFSGQRSEPHSVSSSSSSSSS